MEPRNFSNNSFVNTSYYLLPLKLSLTVISTVLNGYIIGLFIVVIKTNTYSNWLFFCGVVADFIIGAISVPFFTIYTTFGYWPLGKLPCIIWLITDSAAGSISVFCPLIIAIHRYIQIVRPLKVSERMTKYKYAMIAAFWVITYTFWALVVIVPNAKDEKLTACSVIHRFGLVLAADLLFYLLPVSSVLVVNSMIFYELVKRGRRQQQHCKRKFSSYQVDSKESNRYIVVKSSELDDIGSDVKPAKTTNNVACAFIHVGSGVVYQRKRSKELRALVCLYVVAGALITFFAWFCVTWPIRAYCESCISELMLNIGYWLSYTYPCLNPVLLLIFHDKFKTEFFRSINLIRIYFRSANNCCYF